MVLSTRLITPDSIVASFRVRVILFHLVKLFSFWLWEMVIRQRSWRVQATEFWEYSNTLQRRKGVSAEISLHTFFQPTDLFFYYIIGMVSFFDFIVAANGNALKDVDGSFIELIKEYEDKPLPLTLYNIKNHSTRDITLTPSRNWPGEGMLGVTIRFDSFYKAEVHSLLLCYILTP